MMMRNRGGRRAHACALTISTRFTDIIYIIMSKSIATELVRAHWMIGVIFYYSPNEKSNLFRLFITHSHQHMHTKFILADANQFFHAIIIFYRITQTDFPRKFIRKKRKTKIKITLYCSMRQTRASCVLEMMRCRRTLF